MTEFDIYGLVTAAEFVGMALLVSGFLAVIVAAGYAATPQAARRSAQATWGQRFTGAISFVFMLTLVGALTGQLGGGSREGVVGQIVPALMTLFGGFMVYFLGVKTDRNGKIGVSTIAFLLGFFVMYNVATVWRQGDENIGFCRALFSNPNFTSDAQRFDRSYYWNGYCNLVLTGKVRASEDHIPALAASSASQAVVPAAR